MSIDYLATFWIMILYIIPMIICWKSAKNVYNTSDSDMVLASALIIFSFLPIGNLVIGYLLALTYILEKLKQQNKK